MYTAHAQRTKHTAQPNPNPDPNPQASLGKLSALVEAHLSFNQLRSPLPAGLGGLARLKVLRARDRTLGPSCNPCAQAATPCAQAATPCMHPGARHP